MVGRSVSADSRGAAQRVVASSHAVYTVQSGEGVMLHLTVIFVHKLGFVNLSYSFQVFLGYYPSLLLLIIVTNHRTKHSDKNNVVHA